MQLEIYILFIFLTNLLKLPEGASKETMRIYFTFFLSACFLCYFLYIMYVYPFFRINIIIIRLLNMR